MDETLCYESLYRQKKNVRVNKISEKYKKVLINLHQWLLGAEAENNIFLPLPDSLQWVEAKNG